MELLILSFDAVWYSCEFWWAGLSVWSQPPPGPLGPETAAPGPLMPQHIASDPNPSVLWFVLWLTGVYPALVCVGLYFAFGLNQVWCRVWTRRWAPQEVQTRQEVNQKDNGKIIWRSWPKYIYLSLPRFREPLGLRVECIRDDIRDIYIWLVSSSQPGKLGTHLK